MPIIIQTNRLTKSYGRSQGIIDVSFDIQEGEVFGSDGYLGHPFKNGRFETKKDLHLLLANIGELV